MIASSEKYRKYLITESKELFFKEEKTKMGVIYIKNPTNPFRPSRIIGLPFIERALWSWKEVYRVHMSDTAISGSKHDEGIYAAGIGRLANTNGHLLMESPPRGTGNGFYKYYEKYKDNKNPMGTVYAVWVDDALKLGVISKEHLDDARITLGPLFASFYGSSFTDAIGNMFSQLSIKIAKQEGELYNPLEFNPRTEKYILADQGFMSSPFAILVLELVRTPTGKQVRVLLAEEHENPLYEDMRDRILRYRKLFGNVQNIGFDATHRIEFGMSLKEKIGEDYVWSRVKKKVSLYKEKGWNVASSMIVVPIVFTTEEKLEMDSHTRKILDDHRRLVAINPMFGPLISGLEGATTNTQGLLDKDISQHDDLVECFMMGMKFFQFRRKGE